MQRKDLSHSIFDMPADIIRYLLTFLDIKDIIRLKCTKQSIRVIDLFLQQGRQHYLMPKISELVGSNISEQPELKEYQQKDITPLYKATHLLSMNLPSLGLERFYYLESAKSYIMKFINSHKEARALFSYIRTNTSNSHYIKGKSYDELLDCVTYNYELTANSNYNHTLATAWFLANAIFQAIIKANEQVPFFKLQFLQHPELSSFITLLIANSPGFESSRPQLFNNDRIHANLLQLSLSAIISPDLFQQIIQKQLAFFHNGQLYLRVKPHDYFQFPSIYYFFMSKIRLALEMTNPALIRYFDKYHPKYQFLLGVLCLKKNFHIMLQLLGNNHDLIEAFVSSPLDLLELINQYNLYWIIKYYGPDFVKEIIQIYRYADDFDKVKYFAQIQAPKQPGIHLIDLWIDHLKTLFPLENWDKKSPKSQKKELETLHSLIVKYNHFYEVSKILGTVLKMSTAILLFKNCIHDVSSAQKLLEIYKKFSIFKEFITVKMVKLLLEASNHCLSSIMDVIKNIPPKQLTANTLVCLFTIYFAAQSNHQFSIFTTFINKFKSWELESLLESGLLKHLIPLHDSLVFKSFSGTQLIQLGSRAIRLLMESNLEEQIRIINILRVGLKPEPTVLHFDFLPNIQHYQAVYRSMNINPSQVHGSFFMTPSSSGFVNNGNLSQTSESKPGPRS